MRLFSIASVVLLAVLPCAATAQPPVIAPVKLSKSNGYGLKNAKIALLSYSINFVTGQRASANATVGVKARAGTSLIGVDEATMRQLVNEAHADLKAQMAAAGREIVVDLPRWTKLVQTAYRTCNAAIVANLLAVRN